jgi:hypothetical protein
MQKRFFKLQFSFEKIGRKITFDFGGTIFKRQIGNIRFAPIFPPNGKKFLLLHFSWRHFDIKKKPRYMLVRILRKELFY